MKKTIFLTSIITLAFFLASCQSVPKTITFKDRIGHKKHTVQINQNIKSNSYNSKYFVQNGIFMDYVDQNYTVKLGIDISRHDGEIDWQEVKNAGIEFVIFRVAWRGYESGILHTDENFHENIKGAIDAGIKYIGVYVFSQAKNEQETLEEANLALKEIENYPINLPVFFDPEFIANDPARSDNIPFQQFAENAILFCRTIEQAGYKAGVYANLAWETMIFDLERLQNYSIWYADYHKIPETPYHFDFWQYSAIGRVPGCTKITDLNMWIIHNDGDN